MNSTATWHAWNRATGCALAAVILLAVSSAHGHASPTNLVSIERDVRLTRSVRSIAAVPMESATTPGLQSVQPRTSHLGAFGIVINAGPSLAGDVAALAAFNRAAALWDDVIADPITVTIDADLAPLGPTILGATGSVALIGSYPTIRDALVLDAQDEADDFVATQLPSPSAASFFLPTGFGLDGNLQLTKANAKALGFADLDALFGASDGSITFSSEFAFDYDNSDGVTPGRYDFETVAAHEIGHALGFISDVDYVDAALNLAVAADDVRPTTLDMFRFADEGIGSDPASLAEFAAFPRSLVPGTVEILDQITAAFGGDLEILFSTGDTQGDGQQASHWKDLSGLGIMDPTLSSGVVVPITANDLRALDLIGYEISQGVPEPGAIPLAAMIAIALAGVRQRG